MKSIDYAQIGANTLIKKFKPNELPPVDRFHYHQGIFLAGVEQLYNITNDDKYREYIKSWIDFNIDENGYVKNCCYTEFDDIEPGNLLFDLYKTTNDKRYKIVLDKFKDLILNWPINSEGGVWHKYRCPNQMWLDSMYMMGVFSAKYSVEFGCKETLEKAYTLMKLIRKHMVNPETGLMYHMYYESYKDPSVDILRGIVDVHWGRAMGWFAVAMAEFVEILPKDNQYRQEFVDAEISLLNSLKKYQSENGLWYQVVDKIDDNRNWYETSCSALFTYAITKSLRLGIIDSDFENIMIKGYNGVLSKTSVQNDNLNIDGICVGTGVGPLYYYFERPTHSTDLHGMGAFLLMCTEIHKYTNGGI